MVKGVADRASPVAASWKTAVTVTQGDKTVVLDQPFPDITGDIDSRRIIQHKEQPNQQGEKKGEQ